MKSSLRAGGIGALAIALCVACSGETEEGAAGGAGAGGASGSGPVLDASAGSAGAGGALSPNCPTQLPASGSACNAAGLECEYGADVDLECNTLARCDAGGWTITPPRAQGCPTGPLPAACPTSYSDVAAGQVCQAAVGCIYAQGRCSCEVWCGPQYPVGHECEAGTPMTWVCDGPSAGCPVDRPLVGSACSNEGQSCAYGDCETPTFQCTAGTWHTTTYGCPISTARVKHDIRYLTQEDRRSIAQQALDTRLAYYEYTMGEPGLRLGFIIEDQPTSMAVHRGHDRVDLYGYTSMAIAALQEQRDQIAQLRDEVASLRVQLAKVQSEPKGPPSRRAAKPR